MEKKCVKLGVIRKALGLESKEKEIEEKIRIINQLMNTFLGLDPEASLKDTKERLKKLEKHGKFS